MPFGLQQAGANFTCTEQQLSEVLALLPPRGSPLVPTEDIRQTLGLAVCKQYDCTSASLCVLQYLASSQLQIAQAVNNAASKETTLGLDVMFVLFSAFLVFMMQLVSQRS